MNSLSDYRKAADMTQVEVAAMLDITQTAVSQWECGLTRPNITLVPKLASWYGVTVDEIIAAITAARRDSA